MTDSGKIGIERSRKAYYLDDEAYTILWKMHKKTGKEMSVLVNDAIKLTYTKISQLSEEETKDLERLARMIYSFFPANLL